MNRKSLLAYAILLTLPLSAQVVFSRRVYAEHGNSALQIWMWRPSNGSLVPLTREARMHAMPLCSRDGKQIFFISGTERATTGVWSFNRKTGHEKEILHAVDISAILGTAKDGALLILRSNAVYKLGRVPVRLFAACQASVSPEGSRIAFNPCNSDALFLAGSGLRQGHESPPANRPHGLRMALESRALPDKPSLFTMLYVSSEWNNSPSAIGRQSPSLSSGHPMADTCLSELSEQTPIARHRNGIISCSTFARTHGSPPAAAMARAGRPARTPSFTAPPEN
ncbi:MAG TPA: hypothetical protein VG675_21465 [Bryobacteraceae bacterium]|nr:hypothetical protein [Bryobacteraceae bacterium]